MPLSIPHYLASSGIQQNSVHFKWDDWSTPPELAEVNAGLLEKLNAISLRAALAFACGSAEWIVYRFTQLCDVTAPWSYLEAAWATVIDTRYVAYGDRTGWQTYAFKGWDGPIKRPIRNALNTLEIAFDQLAADYWKDPPVCAVRISMLACYVMADPAPYLLWRGTVLDRLQRLYPRDPQDPIGDVVPRHAVDPDIDFDPDETEALIRRFLASLDYKSDLFLSTPEGMLEHIDGEEDLIGQPYVFSIAEDRRRRKRSNQGHTHEDS